MSQATLPPQADAVFEGGGVKGIAFAGAVRAAEQAGVREWKNVAGTSAGAIAACLLVVGYHADGLRDVLSGVQYRRFPDYGFGGVPRGVLNSLWMRGLAPGRFFTEWLSAQVAASPLAKALGKEELTFADIVRDDLPADIEPALEARARFRLRVIASDVTGGRMLVLPQDIAGFTRRSGEPYRPEDLGLVEAVRMSMSFPFLYDPVTLWKDGRPHYVVDGGVLSNFPVWLFDRDGGGPAARPTWGFRLHGGTADVAPEPHRKIPLPFWRLRLGKAMVQAATEAWDRDHLARTQAVRTVGIPTGDVGTTDFGITSAQAEELRLSGERSARAFFASPATAAYLERFTLPGPRAGTPVGVDQTNGSGSGSPPEAGRQPESSTGAPSAAGRSRRP